MNIIRYFLIVNPQSNPISHRACTLYAYNTRCRTNVSLMLGQRRRRWPSIKPASGQHLALDVLLHPPSTIASGDHINSVNPRVAVINNDSHIYLVSFLLVPVLRDTQCVPPVGPIYFTIRWRVFVLIEYTGSEAITREGT